MVALAFALEAALAMSFKHQGTMCRPFILECEEKFDLRVTSGFHIPIANAFAFASTQFVVVSSQLDEHGHSIWNGRY